MKRILIPRAAFRDLTQVVELGNKLKKVHSILNKIAPKLNLDDLEIELSNMANISLSQSSAVIHILMHFYFLRDEADDDPATFFQLITRSIEHSADQAWKDQYFELWNKQRTNITSLLNIDNFVVTIKAYRLAYDHQLILHDSYIVTDVRPIFAATKLELVGSLITSTLSLKYEEGDIRKEIHLSVDVKDIQTLLRESQRALDKVSVLKKELARTKLITFVGGEDRND